jgi:glycogen debranching enzyme
MQGQPLQGFFAANTRFLSHYDIRVNDQFVSHKLSAQLTSSEWSSTGAILGSGDSGNLPEGKLPRGSIEVRTLRKIDQGWTELIFVKNNGIPKRRIKVEISFSCPVSDQEFTEEMKKENTSPKKGIKPRAIRGKNGIRLHYERDFGRRKHLPSQELRKMYGSNLPAPNSHVTRSLDISVLPRKSNAAIRLGAKVGKLSIVRADSVLGAREELCLEIRYTPTIDETQLPAPGLNSLQPLPRKESEVPRLKIDSSNSTLNLMIAQATIDLPDLSLPIFGKTDLPENEYLAYNAGIPRYIGLFGRDNLVTSWQSPVFGFQHYESVLKRLELVQGVKKDSWRDEELNRFPHERRLDPCAEVGEVNRLLYYGDVTSTPFWILALKNLHRWSGEKDLLLRHQTTVLKCCEWILARLKEGDGFIYYLPSDGNAKDETRNQAWKDSGDAIVDADGRVQVPPLAVAEIQGYAYLALVEAHQILKKTQPEVDYSYFIKEADALKDRFNHYFWLPHTRFFAIALDKNRKPVASKASNIGHCLSSGIIREDRLEDVARGLMSEDLFSGWGIRTLSSDNPGYDPFSYHRGAVWPVENAFIAHGLAENGFHTDALRVITAQFAAAAIFPHTRLPEVLSGHSRNSVSPAPGIYNHGNLYQAWSVSALAQNLQTLLGIQPRADEKTLYLNPHLPEWLQWIELRGLRVGKDSLDIRFWRDEEGKSRWKQINSANEIKIRSGQPQMKTTEKDRSA